LCCSLLVHRISGFPLWAGLEYDALHIPLRLMPFGFPEPATDSGFPNSLSCFSGGDASKRGFPVVARQINYTGGKKESVLRATTTAAAAAAAAGSATRRTSKSKNIRRHNHVICDLVTGTASYAPEAALKECPLISTDGYRLGFFRYQC